MAHNCNPQNLGDFRDLSAEERRELSRKAGKISGEKRRRQRLEREVFDEFWSAPVKDFKNLSKIAAQHGLKDSDSVQALYNKLAILGEIKKRPSFDGILKAQQIKGERSETATTDASAAALENMILSPLQERFLSDPLARINLLYGAVRSGKTFVSLVKFAEEVKNSSPGDEFLIAGKTLTSVSRNCFSILSDMFGKNWNVALSAKRARLFGRNVWIEGANDERSESKIRGMTLKGAYLDELTQVPEAFYLMCLSRLSKPGAFLIATTNPDAPTHYVNESIIKPAQAGEIDARCVKFTMDDNIHLDAEYVEQLKKEYSGVYYDRFILGEFVRAEGLVFPSIAERPNAWNVKADDLPKMQTVEVGFDIGGQGSFHALTAAGEGVDGVQYVLAAKSIDPVGMNMVEIEQAVTAFCERVESVYGCEISFINADWVDVVINSINDNTRWRCGKTYKPPLTDRPLTIGRLLATDSVRFVAGECSALVDELSQCVYDERAEKDIILDDGSMRIDTIDSFVYSLSGRWAWLSKEKEGDDK